MECFECGETINPNLRYCLHCGVSLEAMYAAPPTMPADKLPPLPLFMQAAPQPVTVAAARVQPISQPEMSYLFFGNWLLEQPNVVGRNLGLRLARLEYHPTNAQLFANDYIFEPAPYRWPRD